ncbi:aldehyde dehydrogenase family protein [Nocardia sp. NPDC058518]|uniref:aldehyde dehydrogenase family protein n=1 Tax=Nocardia sp. NPDC058518 TaxID=3346534 RepID=UPI0036572612
MIEVHNPADGRIVGTVADTDPAQVAAVVARLRSEQPAWAALAPSERVEWILRLQDWIFANSAEIADLMQAETAKPRVDAEVEPMFVAEVIGYYAANAARFLAPEQPRPHSPANLSKKLAVTYHPYPVVGVITPWNYPLALPGIDAVPALLAGAAVVIKPSEATPLSALELARGWAEIGAPPVLEVITGRGATGAAVVDAVDFVQFTGSTRTGKAVGHACVDRMIPYSLELGGKDPALVLADADIDRAARGIAFGGMLNAGQMCTSIERVYVDDAVYDEFVDRLVEVVGELRMGVDDREFRYDIGPLIDSAQVEIVRRHTAEAVAAGARVVVGGAPTGQGNFFEPTVLVDIDHSMSCIAEETFGPTLPIVRVADEDEAVRLANDSPYALSATVWTGDRARGERVASRLEAGTVNINDAHVNLFNLAVPMGGWKQSGVGARFGGAYGIRKYCRARVVTVDRLPVAKSPSELLWFPYSRRKAGLALGMMRALRARGLRARIGKH